MSWCIPIMPARYLYNNDLLIGFLLRSRRFDSGASFGTPASGLPHAAGGPDRGPRPGGPGPRPRRGEGGPVPLPGDPGPAPGLARGPAPDRPLGLPAEGVAAVGADG